MYGLESITDIRQSSGDNDRHRVVYVGSLHLILDIDIYDSIFSIQHSCYTIIIMYLTTAP